MTPDQDNIEENKESYQSGCPVVPSSYGGYLMQTFFALYELCCCNNNDDSLVSIEFVDDVGVQRGDESLLLQLKTAFSGNPTSDLSVELWKTIYNWCQLPSIDDKKLEYVVISFHDFSEGKLLEEMSSATNRASAEAVYTKIVEKLSSSNNKEQAFLTHRQYLTNAIYKDSVINVIINMHLTIFKDTFCSSQRFVDTSC